MADYICVEVLLENEKTEFKKYGVEFMPTMLILTSEGRETGRFEDFHPPADFIRKLGECAAAEKNLKKAAALLTENPESAEGLYLRAAGYLYKTGEMEKTFENLDKLALLKPEKESRIYVCKGLLMLAEIADKRHGKKSQPNSPSSLSERSKLLKRIVEIDPKNETGQTVEALYRLGVSQIRNAEEMRKFFDRVRAFDPRDTSGYADDMAFAESMAPFYAKDYKTAASLLEDFTGKYAKSELVPSAYFQTARCYYYAKDKNKAAEVLEKLLREYPKAKEANSARSLLKRLQK